MAVSGHLQLILLIPVLSLCGATEYYVRPTEPTNTSCPAQPCLTLNQYVNDSDHYFQSNTVFKFLPGTHHMDRPVTIGNVHNMSLESFSSERPHLVAQFFCETEPHDCIPVSAWKSDFNVCCAAIWLHDVHNVTLRGIIITVLTPNISGVVFRNVSKVTVQLTETYSSCDLYCFGIAIYEADSVEVESSSAYNCTYGLVLHTTTNSSINDITAMYNMWGVVLIEFKDSCISKIFVTQNELEGMYMSNTNNILITNTTATYSGSFGMHLYNMTNTDIINTNTAHNGRCGMYLHTMNSTRIINTATINNGQEGMVLWEMNDTQVTNVTATLNNREKFYSGFVLNGQVTIYTSMHMLICDTSFTDIETSRTITTVDSNSLPAVIGLYQSSVHISECHFTRNSISAINGAASNITVSGNVTFSDNRAFAGTAFILSQDSILIVANNSHIFSQNNYATNVGGVFHITTEKTYTLLLIPYLKDDDIWSVSIRCFLSIEGDRFQTSLSFVNNSAGKGGDILYGGHVALGLDGDWNCLDSFKSISNISQNGLSLISSDPSRVCLCNGTGQPDCLTLADPTPHFIYPGQSINISAVVVGQDFGTVAGSVYAQFLSTSSPGRQVQLKSWQKVQSVTQQNCNTLYYTIFSQSVVLETSLALTARDSDVSTFLTKTDQRYVSWLESRYNTSATELFIYSDNPVYINISLLPCPPGFMLTTDAPFRCDCDQWLQKYRYAGIQCHIQEQTITRSGLLWVGMLEDDNGTNGTVAASKRCPMNYCTKEENNVTLSEPDPQCNYNHSGILCGGCQPGLSLALGSAQCLPCSNKYLALLIPFTLAGPILVGVIKFLDLTISQGTMNGLIFYANIVKANEFIFLPRGQTNPLTIFIAWLNLDLGVETCFFHGLSAYSKTWLQFVFPLYIWSIAGLIIVLAKYSDRVAKVMGNNSVPVLATLFLLSYTKLLRTTITALSYSIVYSSQNTTEYGSYVWAADGNVDYLGPKHAPLFAVAVSTLLFLWLPYTLLLFLGQWLHMCNCRLISHMLMKIKPFLDAHYGPLKGNHRYWFGALLLVRAAILLIKALVPADYISTVVLSILVFAIVLTHYGQLVYRNLAMSAFDTAFYMNLALLSGVTAVGEDPILAAYILIGIALIQSIGLVLFKMASALKQNEKVMACLERLMARFHKKWHVEDDWEAYEEAAILREKEIPEQQDRGAREGYESIVSVPTY